MSNFARFLIGPHRRIGRIIRYATRLRLLNESVAEHTFYVVFYSLILSQLLEERKIKVDKIKVVIRAIVHDLDESVSGDVIRVFREKLKDEFETLNYNSMKYILQDLPDKIKDIYLEEWLKKFDDLEGLIVTIADDISGLVYCKEQLDLGNKAFRPIYDSYLQGILRKIRESSLSFLEEDIKNLEKETFIDNQ
ncbi:MAG: YfbR-like 5'-deoxynucleotidase [Candidatus Hodarchaeota archaeon]